VGVALQHVQGPQAGVALVDGCRVLHLPGNKPASDRITKLISAVRTVQLSLSPQIMGGGTDDRARQPVHNPCYTHKPLSQTTPIIIKSHAYNHHNTNHIMSHNHPLYPPLHTNNAETTKKMYLYILYIIITAHPTKLDPYHYSIPTIQPQRPHPPDQTYSSTPRALTMNILALW